MSDLNKALADIGSIRSALAAGTMFRGFGPSVIAVTGVMAVATAAVQTAWPGTAQGPLEYLITWGVTALASAGLIGSEMIARTRRQHSGIADALLLNAVEHFLPMGVAGVVIAAILLALAPDATWLLPGLMAILVGLGLFAAMRFLPRSVAIAGAWYFVAGAGVLMLASQSRTLDPWHMGLPFGVGQLVLAWLLHVALGGDDEQA
jgi:hypothetical protein